jgi:hypothetical protein
MLVKTYDELRMEVIECTRDLTGEPLDALIIEFRTKSHEKIIESATRRVFHQEIDTFEIMKNSEQLNNEWLVTASHQNVALIFDTFVFAAFEHSMFTQDFQCTITLGIFHPVDLRNDRVVQSLPESFCDHSPIRSFHGR